MTGSRAGEHECFDVLCGIRSEDSVSASDMLSYRRSVWSCSGQEKYQLIKEGDELIAGAFVSLLLLQVDEAVKSRNGDGAEVSRL